MMKKSINKHYRVSTVGDSVKSAMEVRCLLNEINNIFGTMCTPAGQPHIDMLFRQIDTLIEIH